MKVGIIGSGNVGITTAFAVAEKGSGHVVLWGRTPGKAQGKALDLAEASPIRRYDVRIEGTEQFEKLMDASVLVVAAGAARKAGMSRFDLLDDNLQLVEQLADRIAREHRDAGGPLAPLVIMMTEPVDVMTLAFQRRASWPRERVLGVGGGLAAARMRHFISRELGISPADVDAMVLGTHGEGAVILERYCRVSGLPLAQFLSREKIDSIFDRTLKAGTWIVEQARVGSSFYTPGAAASELIHAIANDNNRVLLTSVVLEGEYGVSGRAATVPVAIGCSGVKRVFELALTDEERAAFARSVELQAPHVAKLGLK
jgi:malate dehydrogenase